MTSTCGLRAIRTYHRKCIWAASPRNHGPRLIIFLRTNFSQQQRLCGVCIGRHRHFQVAQRWPLSTHCGHDRYTRQFGRMVTVIKRLVISLLAGGIGLVAVFAISYRLFLLGMAGSHDGQAGMSAFFGAVFTALAFGMLTVAVVFKLSRRWV